MNKNELWQQIKNDTTTVYNEPIFDVFLKTIDDIHKDHYATLTLDQKKLLKPVLRLKMSSSNFRKEDTEVIDSALKDLQQNDTRAIVGQVIQNAVSSGNIDLIDYFLRPKNLSSLTPAYVPTSFPQNKLLSKEDLEKKGKQRIIGHILSDAIRHNQLGIVRHLNEKQLLDNLDDIDILNAFAISIKNGWIKIVKYFFDEVIEKRKQVDERNIKQKAIEYLDVKQAMKTAANFSYFEVIRFLLENGFFEENVLSHVAKEGDLELVKMMIEKMNLKKPMHQNSLNDAFVTAAAGISGGGSNIDMVKYLAEIIKKTTKPAYLSSYKRALIRAVIQGNVESTKYIIDNFDVDISDIKKAISHVPGPFIFGHSTGQKIRDYLNEKYKELST